jgi:SAM-dependent methyltransferase
MSSALSKCEKVHIVCPLCGSEDFRTKWKPTHLVDDPSVVYGAASGVQGTQQIVKCVGCGLLYENPRFPDVAILEAYENSVEAGHDSQYDMRVDSFSRALKRLAGKLPGPGAKVLDVGTAGGAFLVAAQRFGYDAVGVEPSADLADRGRARGARIRQGPLERQTFAPGSFDLVCLWDVIEHVTDPRAMLLRVHSLLRPDGTLLINYPDIGTVPAKLFGRRFWWVISVHLAHYSRRTLRELCRRCGFDVFHYSMYWQHLQLGYLQDLAVHYRIPLSPAFRACTPRLLQRMGIPYYASQTTALARKPA